MNPSRGTDGVAGGAIMSNGNVALILDIAGLVRVAHSTDMSLLCGGKTTDAPGDCAGASVDPVIAEVPAGNDVVPENLEV